jgi:hypothetical protein
VSSGTRWRTGRRSRPAVAQPREGALRPAVHALAGELDAPASALSRAPSRCSSVLLPDPERPDDGHDLAARASKSAPSRTRLGGAAGAVRLHEAAGVDHGQATVGARRQGRVKPGAAAGGGRRASNDAGRPMPTTKSSTSTASRQALPPKTGSVRAPQGAAGAPARAAAPPRCRGCRTWTSTSSTCSASRSWPSACS